MVKGKYIENDSINIETDESTYEISYSVRFVDNRYECIAKLRYGYQSWRSDPTYKERRIVGDKNELQRTLEAVIGGCRDAIEEIEAANDIDLSVNVT